MPKSMEELFKVLKSKTDCNWTVTCYMVELYKKELRDLGIQPKEKKVDLKIQYDASTG